MVKAMVLGHCLYLDLSKITVKAGDGKQCNINQDNWQVMVCEAIGKKWSDFTETKVGMVERTCKQLQIFKTRGIGMQYIRLDPAGENMKLAKQACSSDWAALQPINFKIASQDIPQHNNLAELAFP